MYALDTTDRQAVTGAVAGISWENDGIIVEVTGTSTATFNNAVFTATGFSLSGVDHPEVFDAKGFKCPVNVYGTKTNIIYGTHTDNGSIYQLSYSKIPYGPRRTSHRFY